MFKRSWILLFILYQCKIRNESQIKDLAAEKSATSYFNTAEFKNKTPVFIYYENSPLIVGKDYYSGYTPEKNNIDPLEKIKTILIEKATYRVNAQNQKVEITAPERNFLREIFDSIEKDTKLFLKASEEEPLGIYVEFCRNSNKIGFVGFNNLHYKIHTKAFSNVTSNGYHFYYCNEPNTVEGEIRSAYAGMTDIIHPFFREDINFPDFSWKRFAIEHFPEIKNYPYSYSPLSSRKVLEHALREVAALFPPQHHRFILVLKSHGNKDYALTARIQFDLNKIAPEKIRQKIIEYGYRSKRLQGQLDEQKLAKNELEKNDLIKNELAKNELAKDELTKDELTKDDLAKNELAKNELAKDELTKDELTKDDLAKNELGKNDLNKNDLGKQGLEIIAFDELNSLLLEKTSGLEGGEPADFFKPKGISKEELLSIISSAKSYGMYFSIVVLESCKGYLGLTDYDTYLAQQFESTKALSNVGWIFTSKHSTLSHYRNIDYKTILSKIRSGIDIQDAFINVLLNQNISMKN